jgi:hypothetical protein
VPIESAVVIAEYLDAACSASRVSALEVAAEMGVRVYAVPAHRLAFDVAQVFRARGRWVVQIDETISKSLAELVVLHELSHVAIEWFGLAMGAMDEELCCDAVAEELLARRLRRRSEQPAPATLEEPKSVRFHEIVEYATPRDNATVRAARCAA